MSVQDEPFDRTVLYYTPSIPDVESTVRYNHPNCIAETVTDAHLITSPSVPQGLASKFDSVAEVAISSLRSQIQQAGAAVREVVEQTDDPEPALVTSFHHAPAIVGYRSDATWVVDAFDDPLQYRLNNPRSHHTVSAYLLRALLGQSDRQVYSIHPATPGLTGGDKRFNLYGDGCPIEMVTPATSPVEDGLQGVWAGSPRLDRGMGPLIDALARLDADRSVHVDVYGSPYEAAQQRATGTPAADRLTFHGNVEHEALLEAIGRAHFGLCVLPRRRDWMHSVTIKTREYLAGGTVPVVSDFPGLRLVGEDAAVYVEPTGQSLARGIEHLSSLDATALRELGHAARERAEEIPMDKETSRWLRKALGNEGIGGEFCQ